MIKILHNPKCSTSRYALEAIREAGHEAEIIEYLKTPPSREEVMEIAKASGLGLEGILRKKAKEYKELGLEGATDEEILDAIEEHPVLIERPIVMTDKITLLARPKEKIHEIL